MRTESHNDTLESYFATRLASLSDATLAFLARWPSALFELQEMWTRQFLTVTEGDV